VKAFKENIWQYPRMKRILEIPEEPQFRLLLLSEDIKDPSLQELPEHLRNFCKVNRGEPQTYHIKLGYDNLSVEEVLKR